MSKFLAILMCLVFPLSVFASDNGYKIAYDGGSIENAKAGTGMKLYIDGSNIRIMKDKTEIAIVPVFRRDGDQLWAGRPSSSGRSDRRCCCLFWNWSSACLD